MTAARCFGLFLGTLAAAAPSAWNTFTGLELFLDDEMISWSGNLHRTIYPVTKHAANPVVRTEHPWEQSFTTIYGSVLRDPARGLFRMWYNAYGADYGNQQYLAYAESPDGVQWNKPMMDLVPFGETPRTNILFGREANVHGPAVVRNPQGPPEERYLLMFDSYTKHRPGSAESKLTGRAVYIATSADGIHFEPKQGRLAVPGKSDVGHSLVWNPERGTWQAFLRGVNEYVDEGGLRQRVRYVRLSESTDAKQWSEPVELMKTDEIDGAPDVQMHQFSVTRYGPVYIGLLSLFRIDRLEFDAEYRGDKGIRMEFGKTETQLAISRDGVHWQRVANRGTFLPLGAPDQWDGGWIVTASQMVAHDGRVLIYYGGANGRFGKKTEIGLATVPLDRFVAMKPKRLNAEAILELKPFHYPEPDLVLNADASKGGEIQVEVLNYDGSVIKGFERTNFLPVRGDQMQHPLRWKSESGPRGLPAQTGPGLKAVRLRFYLRNAEIYSLRSASMDFGVAGK
ncbi:MAG: hypothetical protein U0R19_32425 [Bryobacteraceae bacterium]